MNHLPGFHKGGGNHVCAFTSPPLVTPTRPVPFKAGAASAYRRVGATDNMVLDIDVSGIIVSVGTALASLPGKRSDIGQESVRRGQKDRNSCSSCLLAPFCAESAPDSSSATSPIGQI
ncbi:MAG: hypothetical protein K6C07_07470, partial [Bacteroidales bacterium]|nr:hypothetical protein [Bacteroidales bacterium]